MAKFLSSFGMRACFDLYSTCERNPFFDLNKSSDMLGLIIKVVPREEHPLLPLGKHLSYEKPAVTGVWGPCHSMLVQSEEYKYRTS